MEMVVTTRAIGRTKLRSERHHQQTKAPKGKYHIHGLAHLKLTRGLPTQFSSTTG